MCNSEQKFFPFYLIFRLIFAHVVCIYDQCIYCSNVDHAIKHCQCPSASCSRYCVPCTHLIQYVYYTFCFVIKFNDFRLSWIAADCWIMMQWWKEDNWFVLLWDIWHKCEILSKYKNRWLFVMLPCRRELMLNFSFALLHCPKKCQFVYFCSWFARSTDVNKLSVVTFRPPLSWPEISWTNVQTTSLVNSRATLLFSLPK